MTVQEPDLILGGTHLGRGTCYYDKEACKLYYFNNLTVNKIIFYFLDIT